MGASTLPTYHGLVKDTNDALILFHLAIDGRLELVKQRLSEEERNKYVQSGNIFIFQERASSIYRWTDGISWSPSRIVGDFLVYREVKKDESGHRRDNSKGRSRTALYRDRSRSPGKMGSMRSRTKRPNPELVGSLSDEDKYKEGGLVKRTITVQFKENTYHLISYYTLEDAEEGRLPQISNDPAYANLDIYQELVNSKSLRVRPNEHLNPMVHEYDQQHPPPIDVYAPYGRYAEPPYTPIRGTNPSTYMPTATTPISNSSHRYLDSMYPDNAGYNTPNAWTSPNRLMNETYSPSRPFSLGPQPAWPSLPTPTDSGSRSSRESRVEEMYSPAQRLYVPTNHEMYENIDHTLSYDASNAPSIQNSVPVIQNRAGFTAPKLRQHHT